MYFYNIVFLILACLSFVELFGHYPIAYKKMTVKIVSVFWLVCSAVYAGPMGDFYVYEDYFKNTNSSHLLKLAANEFEYGYELINVIVHWFTDEYWVLRLVLASIVMVLWYKIYFSNGLSFSNRYSITMLLVLWTLNFGNIFIIRSTVAVAFCVYSIRYIEKRNLKKFLVCSVLAMGFHTMAIIWFAAYFVYHQTRFRKIYYGVIIFAFVFSSYIPNLVVQVSSLFGSYIYNRVYNYISYGINRTLTAYDYFFTVFKAMINIVFLLSIFVYICYRKKRNNTMSNEDGLLNLYVVGSVVYALALFSSPALTRAALSYNAAQYILIPKIFDLSEIRNKMGTRLIVFGIFVLYLYLRLYINTNSADYIPFLTIF